MVVLEKHHHFLRKETLREAAEKAYGHSFAPGHADYQVTQSTSTFVKIGEDVIHITQSSQPHVGRPHEVQTEASDHQMQHGAWKEHKGYFVLELYSKNRPKKEAYGVMAKLAQALMDDNIVGVYLPRDNEFYPNDGSAASRLKHFIG